jgi:hypothetical protein
MARPTMPEYEPWTIRHFSTDGIVELDAEYLSDDERSLIGQHYNGGERYLRTGRTDDYLNDNGKLIRGLDYFEGMEIDGFEFNTNTNDWDDAYMIGELDQGPYVDSMAY